MKSFLTLAMAVLAGTSAVLAGPLVPRQYDAESAQLSALMSQVKEYTARISTSPRFTFPRPQVKEVTTYI